MESVSTEISVRVPNYRFYLLNANGLIDTAQIHRMSDDTAALSFARGLGASEPGRGLAAGTPDRDGAAATAGVKVARRRLHAREVIGDVVIPAQAGTHGTNNSNVRP